MKEKYLVESTEDPVDIMKVNKDRYSYIISAGYAHKVPEEIIRIYRNKIINLHSTYLPWGKGIGPLLFSFLLSQPVGISFHLIEKDFDTGNILHRVKIEPSVHDTARTLYKKLLNLIDNEFVNYWPLMDGSILEGLSQKHFNLSTPYFSRLDFEKMILNFPKGYDTNLFDLHTVGKIQQNNYRFLNKVFNKS